MGGDIIGMYHERKQIRNLQEILDAMQVGIRSSPTALYISNYFFAHRYNGEAREKEIKICKIMNNDIPSPGPSGRRQLFHLE